MKKTLIAFAALAVVGAASAQVTISGAIGFGWNSAGGVKSFGRTDGNINASVTEDLGGGLKISANGGIDLANRGVAANGRNLGMSLSGGFGTLSMANVNAPNSTRLSGAGGTISLTKDIDDVYGDDPNLNTVGYTAPAFGPVTVGLGFSHATGAAFNADSADLSATYADGPVKIVVTHRPDDSRTRLSGTVGLGMVNIGFGYVNKYGTRTAAQSEWEIWAPLGAVTVGAQMAKLGAADGTAMGVKYDLSKRTSLIASTATINDVKFSRVKLIHSY